MVKRKPVSLLFCHTTYVTGFTLERFSYIFKVKGNFQRGYLFNTLIHVPCILYSLLFRPTNSNYICRI